MTELAGIHFYHLEPKQLEFTSSYGAFELVAEMYEPKYNPEKFNL